MTAALRRPRGRYRWRTRLRRFMPERVLDTGLFAKGTGDCGRHEWYNHDDLVAYCYHCEIGESPWPLTPGA